MTEKWLIFLCSPSPDCQDLGGVEQLPQDLNLRDSDPKGKELGEPGGPDLPTAQSSEGQGRGQNRIPQRAPLPLSTQTFSLFVIYLLIRLLGRIPAPELAFPSLSSIALVISMSRASPPGWDFPYWLNPSLGQLLTCSFVLWLLQLLKTPVGQPRQSLSF